MNDNANTTVLNFLFSFYTYFIPFGLSRAVCSCGRRSLARSPRAHRNIVLPLQNLSKRAPVLLHKIMTWSFDLCKGASRARGDKKGGSFIFGVCSADSDVYVVCVCFSVAL